MRRLACFALIGLVLPLVGACDLMKLLQGNATTVQLANSGDYPVIVKLHPKVEAKLSLTVAS